CRSIFAAAARNWGVLISTNPAQTRRSARSQTSACPRSRTRSASSNLAASAPLPAAARAAERAAAEEQLGRRTANRTGEPALVGGGAAWASRSGRPPASSPSVFPSLRVAQQGFGLAPQRHGLQPIGPVPVRRGEMWPGGGLALALLLHE